jgi:glycosyltransferase involved in cell wall biosynthesis
MKVIFCHPYPASKNEGLDRAVLGLARGLSLKGVSVEFVILQSTRETLFEYQQVGKVWCSEVCSSRPTSKDVGRRMVEDMVVGNTSRKVYKKLERLKDREAILIAAQEFSFGALLRARREDLFKSVGWWCSGTPHLYPSVRPIRAALDKTSLIGLDLLALLSPFLNRKFWQLEELDFIITVSQWLSNLLTYFGGIHPTGVLYPPTDTDFYSPLRKELSERNGRYVFSLGDTKDVRFDVLNGLSKLVPVIRAGLPEISKAFNLHDVNDKDLTALYASALVTAYPTHVEQYGLPIAESLACGTPVLTFPWQGPGELIKDRVTGWKANTVEDFYEIAQEIVKEGYDVSLREKCREFAVSNLSLEASTDKFLQLMG